MLLCEGRGCRVAAHQQCYGVPSLPTGKWLCDGCSAGISPAASACTLCPCRRALDSFCTLHSLAWPHWLHGQRFWGLLCVIGVSSKKLALMK